MLTFFLQNVVCLFCQKNFNVENFLCAGGFEIHFTMLDHKQSFYRLTNSSFIIMLRFTIVLFSVTTVKPNNQNCKENLLQTSFQWLLRCFHEKFSNCIICCWQFLSRWHDQRALCYLAVHTDNIKFQRRLFTNFKYLQYAPSSISLQTFLGIKHISTSLS